VRVSTPCAGLVSSRRAQRLVLYLRSEHYRRRQKEYAAQQQHIAKTEEFIRRNLAGQKTKQAKSRRKMLERLERLDAVRPEQSSGDFRLQEIERTGNHVLTVTDLAVGYPDKELAKDVTFILRRGECLGVIGPNGSGKTTFLRTIMQKLSPLSGEVRWGTRVQIGYYAQQLDDLDDRNEIIMELRRVAPSTATAGELRSFLAKFLFTGDDVYKHVRDLSGGEKGRLALAKLIYSRVNVLVLDEPTNHLDIRAKDILLNALSAYTGTVVFVSHDRYFIDKLATRVFEIGGGRVEVYPGNSEDFLWRKKGGAAKLQESVATITSPTRSGNGNGSAPVAVTSKTKRINPIKRKHMEERAKKLEEQISSLESVIAACENSLQNFVSAEETTRITQQLDESRTELQKRTAEWEQIGQELETTSDKV